MAKIKRFSHQQIKKMAQRDELSDGTYRFLVTSAKRVEDEGKCLKLRLGINPLTDPEDIASKHRVGMTLDLVMGASETSGDPLEFQIVQSADAALCLLPDMPMLPVWVKSEKKWTDGEQDYSGEEGNEQRATVREEAFNALANAYEDDSNEVIDSLVGVAVFYGDVKRTMSKTGEYAGRIFPNIRNIRKELRDGDSLTAPEDFVHGNTSDVDDVPVVSVKRARMTPVKGAPKKRDKR
jgi:hypothetical protein